MDLQSLPVVFRHDGHQERGAVAVLADRPVLFTIIAGAHPCWVTLIPGGQSVDVGTNARITLSAATTARALVVSGRDCPSAGEQLPIDYKTDAEFCEWLAGFRADSPGPGLAPPGERGEHKYNQLCMACHTLDGAGSVGPSFRDLFGSTVVLSDGSRQLVDEEYVRRVVLGQRHTSDGRFDKECLVFAGQLKDRDIRNLTEFLSQQSSLADANSLPPAPAWPPSR